MAAARHNTTAPHRHGTAARFLAAAALAWLLLVPCLQTARAQSEYQVKAVFLCRFAQYIDWPTNTFATAACPITIGVLGDDPFGVALDDAIKDETPQNRRLVVKRIKRPEDAADCQILFVSRSEKPRLRHILEHLEKTGTLTVGDSESFAQMGGVINFTIQGGKIRLEVNPDAARAQGLKISAQLMKLARLVP
jgi:hypothetical protein